MSKQTTLFQNWGCKNTTSKDEAAADEVVDEFDEETLLAACEEWESEGIAAGGSSSSHLAAPPHGTPLEDLPGFDVSCGHIYIYPINYPLRDYQFNIVQQALFKNTLVSLPTGLGKTFIAAVVMYNFYRWYPTGKIVFMAPTKPLVFQQIEACFNIMGIPQDDMAEMTGNMAPAERKRCWQRQKVFFLTPQVMTNDLSRRACPVMDVKCVVVDEAHKALGNHAYCQVVREISKFSNQFRVLALSATPGGDIKAVNQVLSNLLISHIEIRSEDSLDIRQYVHERKVEKIVVPLSEELKLVKQQYLEILNVYVQRLVRLRVLFCRDPASMTKFQILKAREAFRQDPPPEITAAKRGPVEGDFAICMSLYHGYELLLQHGQRSLYSFLLSIVDGSKGTSRSRSELQRNQTFSNLLDTLEEKYGRSGHNTSTLNNSSHHNSSGLFTSMNSSTAKHAGIGAGPMRKMGGGEEGGGEYTKSHPKMVKLEEVVLEHFSKFSQGSNESMSSKQAEAANTRVMIFAQYRDSVQEITDMLNHHWPSIRCMSFIGQASAGKNTKGFTQKEQIQVVGKFRSGGYNTLVSTCVGEEGLDIGDVDLIVCYDAHKSPIRLVQRMGRTGRKRQGRIVMLVTEGKEAAIYDRSQYSKKGIHRALQGNSKSLHLYPSSPRMVPRGLNPAPHKMNIKVETYLSKHKTKQPQAGKASVKRRSSMGGDISKFLRGIKADPVQDVFLTPEELSFWNLHYKLDSAEQLKPPPRSTFLSFNKSDIDKDQTSSEGHLSLTSYPVWQTNKQSTHRVSHSKRTNTFVEMMEFIEIQGQMDDEDVYGAEMALYLDESDVMRTKSKRKLGILQYCSQEGKNLKDKQESAILGEESGDDMVDTEGRKARSKGKIGGPKTRNKNKKKQVDETEERTSDSSDELPAVDILNSEKSLATEPEPKMKTKEKQKSPTVVSDNNKSKSDSKTKKGKKSSTKDSKKKPDLKAVPLFSASDEEDFDCGAEKKLEKGKKQSDNATHLGKASIQKHNQVKDDKLMSTNLAASSDDEAMDTASDDDLPEIPMIPVEDAICNPLKDRNRRPNRSNSSSDHDSSLNKSDIFLSCSQILKNPEPIGKKKRKMSKGISLELGEVSSKDVMPPPPPSLSGLDLLDDIDLSFSATQLTKTNLSPTKIATDLTSRNPNAEKDNSVISDTSAQIYACESGGSKDAGVVKSTETNSLVEDDEIFLPDDLFSEVEPDINVKAADSLPDKSAEDTTPHEQRELYDKQSAFKQSEGMEHAKIVEPLPLTNEHKYPNDEKAANLTSQLVEAWDNFDGDIFADDDIFDDDLDTAAKTGDTSAENEQKKAVPSRNELDLPNAEVPELPKLKVSDISHNNVVPKSSSGMHQQSSLPVDSKLKSVHNTNNHLNIQTNIMSKKLDNNVHKRMINEDSQSSLREGVEQPQFELDFDFGDFFDMDDEAFDRIDVVPPSPGVSRSKTGFRALSQASQLLARLGTTDKKTNADAPLSTAGVKGMKKDIFLPKANTTGSGRQHQESDSKPTASPMHQVESHVSLTKQAGFRTQREDQLFPKALNFEHPPAIKHVLPKGDISPEAKGTMWKGTSIPPAASTPVSSEGYLNKPSRHSQFISPISEPNDSVKQIETPVSSWLTKPKSSLRSRLSIKNRGQLASQKPTNEGKNIQESLPVGNKRKSSPLVAEGHFEDESVCNPMKKHKTSIDLVPESPRYRHGGQEADIDFLLADIDWEDSLNADSTQIKYGNKTGDVLVQMDRTANSMDKKEHESSDDSEGDIGQIVRKKKARVLMSPDTPSTGRTSVSSKVVTTPTSTKQVMISDNEHDDSSFIAQPKRRRVRKLVDSILIPSGDDDDDDFEAPPSHARMSARAKEGLSKCSSTMDSHIPLRQRLEMRRQTTRHKAESKNKVKKVTRHRHAAAYFLDEEADVSEDGDCSSDELVNSDSENSLDGFINNATQLSQGSCAQDMHAIYLKSVKSPIGGGVKNRFKMMHRSPEHDVFSQVPQQDVTYMEDSFVVQGDKEEELGEALHGSDEEVSMVAMENTINVANIIEEGRGRRSRAGKTLRSRAGESRAARILRAGRAAVLKSDSSASEAEVESEQDLLDWETDFEERSTKKHRKNLQETVPSKRPNRLVNHPNSATRTKGYSEDSSPDKSTGWFGKLQHKLEPSVVTRHDATNHQASNTKVPLRTNYGLMNHGEKPQSPKDVESGQKPCTFVAPRPPPGPEQVMLEDSQTLANREKEERLRRQRQKQAEFLQRMREKQSISGHSQRILESTQPVGGNSQKTMESTQRRTSTLRSDEHLNSKAATMNSTVTNLTTMNKGALMNRTMTSPVATSSHHAEPLVILVDSKELASAPHMVSTLTITYKLNPVVSQLQGCDYVTSTRMGVEKRTFSEFSNGANRQKLLDRVRHLCELFDRPCLIIEKDRVKAQDKKQPKIIPRTKYLDATLAALAKTHVKILFSESTDETAQILSDLVRIEGRKGAAIPTIPDIDTNTQQVLKFYQSIPGVSYVTALTLIHHFPTILDLISTCESVLQSRIKISSVRAKQIMSYLNSCFDEQMTGSSR